jgi:transposase
LTTNAQQFQISLSQSRLWKIQAGRAEGEYGFNRRRQSATYAREGIEIDTSTLADWAGGCVVTIDPVLALLKAHVLRGERIHADSTTVPVLAKGKTATGRLWTYVRDDRPFGGKEPPAAFFEYSRNRAGVHPQKHLAGWTGIMQADANDGYNALYEATWKPAPIKEAACWAHWRRKLFDHAKSGKAPIAVEAVRRMDEIFAWERTITGKPTDERVDVRSKVIAPLATKLCAWLIEQRAKLSAKTDLAKDINYGLKQWDAFTRFLDDGRICMTTDGVEKGASSTRSNFRSWSSFRACRFFGPCRDHLLLGLLCSGHIVVFPVANFLDPVVVAWSRLAIFTRRAGLESSFPQLHRREGWARVNVIATAGQNVPDHHGKLPGRRHGGCRRASGLLHSIEKCAQRTGSELRRPCCFDKHFASVGIALLADTSMPCGMISGLTNLRGQAEVTAELLWRLETRDVANRGQDRRCYDRPNARNRHQANGLRVFQHFVRDRLVETRKLIG